MINRNSTMLMQPTVNNNIGTLIFKPFYSKSHSSIMANATDRRSVYPCSNRGYGTATNSQNKFEGLKLMNEPAQTGSDSSFGGIR